MRVAIIGSGISGLSAAWLLRHHQVDSSPPSVCLYESAPALGMDAESCELSSHSVRVDTPLRVFTETYYPHLANLYRSAGIRVVSECYAGSFSDPNRDAFFKYNNFLLFGFSLPLPSLFGSASLFSSSYLIILYSWLKFLWLSRRAFAEKSVSINMSLGDWL